MKNLWKKVIGWALCLMMTVGMLPVAAREAKAADTDAGAGEGIVWNVEKKYYEISNYAGLLEFAAIVNGTSGQVATNSAANAILTKSFSAEESAQGNTWTPIGNSSSPYFGTFDGKGYTITGLTIESTGIYIGLFGYVGKNGCVQNVNLEGGSIKGHSLVGGVVGYNEGGIVSNCYNTGDVTGGGNIGGVVGTNEGTVSNCYNTGKVSSENGSVGGVVGSNDGTVTNSYNDGIVNGSHEAGGVAGWNDGIVSNCNNSGDVTGGSYVGGVVGGNHSNGEVLNCYNVGDVTGRDTVGGVAGTNSGEVSNCYNTGKVSSEKGGTVGGVAGTNNTNGKISNCYNIGEVSGHSWGNVGGVVGDNGGTVSNCFHNISISQIKAIHTGEGVSNGVGSCITLEMIGTSSGLYTSLKDVKDDDGNLVWLFRRNIDGTYYYPHLAGFNFDKSGNQLAADDIPADEWPGKGTFSFALSGYQFTYTGEIYKPEVVGKVTFDNDEMTEYRVKYLDSENNEIEPKKAGVYRACVYGEETGSSYLERNFEILSIPAILTADSASAECDGTALTKNSYTISGLAKGDSVESVTITGSQTGPGSCDNVPSAAKIVNADGEDVTGCYDITYVNGKLTVSEHSFDKEVADAKHQKSAATCTEAAVYYKSCACGKKGTETFSSGEPLGHDYKAVEGSAVDPSCEKAGKEADQKCERCGDVITGKEIPATGHTFDKEAVDAKYLKSAADCTHAAVYYKSCSKCGAAGTETFESGEPLGHKWKVATGYAPKTCEICGATEGDVIKYTVEGGNTIEFTQGDQQDITKIYHRSEDDKDSFAHYVGVQIDGKDTKIEARSGSIILAFDAKTLTSLSVGEHVVTVVFDDWKDEMKLIVKAPAEEEVKNSPPTGDSGRPILWITLLLLSVAGTSAVVMRRRQRA